MFFSLFKNANKKNINTDANGFAKYIDKEITEIVTILVERSPMFTNLYTFWPNT